MKMDHVARAKSRIINEYRNKDIAVKWLTICPEIGSERLETPLDDIYSSYDVDSVTGHKLDVIGRIVGMPRPIVKVTDSQVFGYLGNDSYVNYNVSPYIGDGEQKELPLSNDLYRKMIKSKIARNISDGTIDSIIESVEIITGIKVAALVDNGDMTFDIGLAYPLDAATAYLVEAYDLIPRPQCTSIGKIFVLPSDIDDIEASSSRIYNYANYTLPAEVA